MYARRAVQAAKPVICTAQATSTINPTLRLQATRTMASKVNEPPKHQMVYFKDLATNVRASGNFRNVLHTGLYSQLVAMEVPVGGDIGEEVHTVDQILLFTSGQGRAEVGGKNQDVKANDCVVVPAGTRHQFVNTGDKPLELITVYSPAEHDPRSMHKTKEEGDQLEEDGKDEAPAWSRQPTSENEKAGVVRTDGEYKE